MNRHIKTNRNNVSSREKYDLQTITESATYSFYNDNIQGPRGVMVIIVGGARGVMVIVVEKGHGDTSSNPRQD